MTVPTLNKGYIARKLCERGMSRRRSVQLLNFILDEVASVLACGEVKSSFRPLESAWYRVSVPESIAK